MSCRIIAIDLFKCRRDEVIANAVAAETLDQRSDPILLETLEIVR